MAVATLCSKEADGATLPFALIGGTLVTGAQLTRRASIAFVGKSGVVQTAFGTLHEAATLVAVVRSAQGGKRRGDTAFDFFSWMRAYLGLLV